MSSLSGHIDADLPPAGSAPAPDREAELLRKAQLGDRGAFGQVAQLHQDRLYNAVLRLVGHAEDARELTQETFVRALGSIDTFRGDSQAYTWLFRIAMNLSISLLRKDGKRRTFSLDGTGRAASSDNDGQASALVDRIAADRRSKEAAPTPAESAERNERHEQVLAALGRIDAEYRVVLVMRDVEGFDYQQMADILGLPLGTLKSRLFRARMALRDELKAYLA